MSWFGVMWGVDNMMMTVCRFVFGYQRGLLISVTFMKLSFSK